MATTTILIGQTYQNNSGINPTHSIRLTDSSKLKLILQSIEGKEDSMSLVPTIENMVDDIYFVISVFILKDITLEKEFQIKEGKDTVSYFRQK